MADNQESFFFPNTYGEFANKLFDRIPSPEYLTMWSELLRHPKTYLSDSSIGSVLLFRLGNDWLGLNTTKVEEVLEIRPIHTMPNSRSKIFLGVVNVRGQLCLCIALHRLLEISSFGDSFQDTGSSSSGTRNIQPYRRMMAIKHNEEMWVFPVDEVHGAVSGNTDAISNLPITVAKSSVNYLKGLWKWRKHKVGLIDEDLLFASLRRMVP
jgi:chemotaxis-related protein WspD